MLPANVGTGIVHWQAGVAIIDGDDEDQNPDMIHPTGTVTFAPSITHVQNVNAVPNPITIALSPIVGVLDEEGYLCTPVSAADRTPMYRGVRLVATDDPDLSVKNWNYSVAYRLGVVNGATPTIPAHPLAVPEGEDIDLSLFAPVPSSPPVGTPQALALLAKAEEAATLAATNSVAALQVVARADAGEFTGDPGPAGLDGSNVLPDSEAVAQAVTLDGPAKTALSAAIGESVKPLLNSTSTLAPSVVTLVSGQVDEAPPGAGVSTRTVDTVNFKIGNQSQKFTVAGVGVPSIIWDWPTAPVKFSKASRVCLWVYVENATHINSITLDIYVDAPAGQGHALWQQTWVKAKIKTGWNLLAYQASAGNLGRWDEAYRVRLQVNCSQGTSFNVGHIWLECQPKAQILFIEDRGYKTFVDNGLPDLRALGVPVTWALDPLKHGTSVGTKAEVVTDADVATFAADGDSISIHAYDGAITATMTPDQIRIDSLKAVRWCQQRGYAGRMWRAAWTQNDAPEHAAAKPYFLAYATPSSSASLASWPPFDRWNIPRLALQGMASAQLDNYFGQMKKTHQLMVIYTHGIHSDGGSDATQAEWDYFIGKITDAIAEGWLEGVTFEDLYARSGGKFKQAFGHAQAEFFDESGDLVRKPML